MKDLWKGIAISGIWLCFAIIAWSPTIIAGGVDALFVAGFGAFILSCVVASK